MTSTPPPTSWETILAGLETELVAAQDALASGALPDLEAWQAPVTTDPVPEHLRERAVALLGQQDRLAATLAQAVRLTRDHLRSTSREQSLAQHVRAATTTSAGPAYLDVVT